ncbi:MAG: glutathione S-transferase [Alphaproteobacteria bacterium]|nr:glutathione S-transferase [Alphaproteobacteria bacterium]
MKLYYTPFKGLIQKVQVVAIEKGVYDKIEARPTVPYDRWEELVAANPLSKVPTLVLDDGTPVFGGPAIYEYLDSLAPEPQLFPAPGRDRWIDLTRLALGEWIFDLSNQRLFERNRPVAHWRMDLVDRFESAIERGLNRANRDASGYTGFTIGQIAIACGLVYHDFQRARGTIATDWRTGRPDLQRWLETITTRPSFTPRDDEIVTRPTYPYKRPLG